MAAVSIAFDLCGALPRGTTLLEASAGTGKTYTIEALATRYVAEGVADLKELLVIAFGRAAAAELRERVRDRMLAARAALLDLTNAAASADPVIRHLAQDRAERDQRVERLSAAVAGFDEATIATTHQFCQRTLASLGLGADVDPHETFVESLRDVADEVVTDLYVARLAGEQPELPAFDIGAARQIGREVINNPQADLVSPDPPPGPARERLEFARSVREEVDRRRRRRSLVGYDDLVGRLAAALRDHEHGARNRAWLRDRYRVVMVDEFQDTDRLQWQILHDAFHDHADLLLIGDPKQAIYGFRGGDVATYLVAADAAHQHLTLPVNHRSDARLVAAVSSLFGAIPMGDPRIRLTDVAGRHGTRLRGPGTDAPIRIRLVSGATSGVDAARAAVNADVAADLSELLHGAGATIRTDDGGSRPVAPGDVAVLVRRWDDAHAIAEALQPYGVRSVTSGSSSVFASDAARHWLTLLRALDQPGKDAVLRAAMLTPILGYTGAQLAGEGGVQHADEAAAIVRAWGQDLRQGGVAALLHSVTTEGGLLTTALGRPDGERELTDLRHVAETLHERSRETPGAGALAAWLAARIRESQGDRREQVQRRVDSDADAVQILTIWGSKGLEYPIVYVPHAWNRWVDGDFDVLRYHDGARRIVDPLGKLGPDWKQRRARHVGEDAGETMRMLYVALTRASRQVRLWWAPTAKSTGSSALHRVLAARIRGEEENPAADYGCDVVTRAAVSRLGLAVESVPDRPRATPAAPAAPGAAVAAADLQLAPYDRAVDTAWRRTSYSGLTRAAHEHIYAAAAESPSGERDDEPAGAEPSNTPAPAGTPSPLAGLPKGATFGTVVHHVLEVLDTDSPDPSAALRTACEQALLVRPHPGVTAALLSGALAPVLATPLGPLAGDRTLADIGVADRLAELDFELPLAPGGQEVLLRDVAHLLRGHLAPGDPLADYPDRMRRDQLDEARLLGFLSGSIDAVLRVGTPEEPRFVVVDYKTNWLGGSDDLVIEQYEPVALAAEMVAAHYPLQALLYAVALHRYLRWRLPGYLPERHLGGMLYLFVRGMAGPATPRPGDGAAPYGVFSWQPGATLVAQLSDLLDGRQP